MHVQPAGADGQARDAARLDAARAAAGREGGDRTRASSARCCRCSTAARWRVPVAETFALADVAAAYDRFAAGGKLGKIVVTMAMNAVERLWRALGQGDWPGRWPRSLARARGSSGRGGRERSDRRGTTSAWHRAAGAPRRRAAPRGRRRRDGSSRTRPPSSAGASASACSRSTTCTTVASRGGTEVWAREAVRRHRCASARSRSALGSR